MPKTPDGHDDVIGMHTACAMYLSQAQRELVAQAAAGTTAELFKAAMQKAVVDRRLTLEDFARVALKCARDVLGAAPKA